MYDGFDTTRSGQLSNRQIGQLLWPLFRPYLAHLAGSLVLLALASALTIAGPLLVKRAIDDDIGGGDYPGLIVTVAWYLAAQVAHLATIYALRNWLEWTGQNMMADLRRRVFNHLLRLPLEFHQRHTPGKLMSRIESDTQALRMLFTTTGVVLLGDMLLLVGMFIAMALVSLRLTLVAALLLPCLILVTIYYQRRIHPLFVQARKQNSEVYGRLTEYLQALNVVRAFDRRRWATGDFQRINQQKYHTNFAGQRLIVRWINLLHLLETVSIAALVTLSILWAATIGTLVMFIGFVRRFFEPLFRLSEQLAIVQRAFAASERIFVLLEEPLTIDDPARPIDWPGLAHDVRFEHVSFRYAPDGPWVLDDVSFELPAGQRWALVGPTGSGKTTIVSLLLRFYEPQRGRILIDGVDIRHMRQEDLRRHVGLVMQDIYLFPGDLTANLALGADYSSERIEAAAALTLADRFIRRLPGGYRASLSERGGNLSVGQRQLLSFSRTLLRDPQLLILDEATSAVDPATEDMITRALVRLLSGRTALVIAHRLSTVQQCDRIVVLQHGRIVQQGTHDQLVTAGGLYRVLHELQFSEAADAL